MIRLKCCIFSIKRRRALPTAFFCGKILIKSAEKGKASMKTHCIRLRRGEDLLPAIRQFAEERMLEAAVVLSGVGCLSRAVLRDADGRTVRTVEEPCEILSLTGTVSRQRCHLHIALSRQGLTAFGGHLMPGCMVNTTCELILGELPGWRFGTEQDSETGYDEIVFTEETP
jgi:predicted DNA-binding protein with PD1-like motif